jgi:hypothetical protein
MLKHKKIKLPAGNFFYTKFTHLLKIENQPFTKQKCISFVTSVSMWNLHMIYQLKIKKIGVG